VVVDERGILVHNLDVLEAAVVGNPLHIETCSCLSLTFISGLPLFERRNGCNEPGFVCDPRRDQLGQSSRCSCIYVCIHGCAVSCCL
jgi:hypothetical protein